MKRDVRQFGHAHLLGSFWSIWEQSYHSVIKNPPANVGDTRDSGSITGSGRSPGGLHGNLLQDFCLENPMDRGAWWATVHGVTKNWTRLSVHTQYIHTSLRHLGLICLSTFCPPVLVIATLKPAARDIYWRSVNWLAGSLVLINLFYELNEGASPCPLDALTSLRQEEHWG